MGCVTCIGEVRRVLCDLDEAEPFEHPARRLVADEGVGCDASYPGLALDPRRQDADRLGAETPAAGRAGQAVADLDVAGVRRAAHPAALADQLVVDGDEEGAV